MAKGQVQDTVSSLYDFAFREYGPVQGRWISPDPPGVAAVDPSKPQSWNRYAFVGNKPLSRIDLLGLRDFSKLDAIGSQGICIEGPTCAFGPFGSSTNYVNGMQVSAAAAASLLGLGAGAAIQCPNNDCSRIHAQSNGDVYRDKPLIGAVGRHRPRMVLPCSSETPARRTSTPWICSSPDPSPRLTPEEHFGGSEHPAD